jgi:hypothetical protein
MVNKVRIFLLYDFFFFFFFFFAYSQYYEINYHFQNKCCEENTQEMTYNYIEEAARRHIYTNSKVYIQFA